MTVGGRKLGRCLVTGAGGFIGRHLASALQTRAEAVSTWTRDRLDMMNPDAVSAALSEFRPDTVFHLASAGVSAASAHDPNVIGRDVLMAAHLIQSLPSGIRLIASGSMAEYGRPGLLNESSLCQPRTAYAIGKHAAGMYLTSYGKDRGLEVCVARLFGVYGQGEAVTRFFPSLIAAMKHALPFAMSDGSQARDFIHVDDVAEVLIQLGQASSLEAVVNIGTGQAVALKDVAFWIASQLGADPSLLQLGARPRSPGDEDLLQADIGRLRSIVAWVPPMRLTPGLDVQKLFMGEPDF